MTLAVQLTAAVVVLAIATVAVVAWVNTTREVTAVREQARPQLWLERPSAPGPAEVEEVNRINAEYVQRAAHAEEEE